MKEMDKYMASGKGSKKHTHKYRMVTVAGDAVFACSLPQCTHYMPKHMEKLVEGKESYCWSCDEIFVMNSDSMKMELPICLKCMNQSPIPDAVLTESLVPESPSSNK